MNYQKRHKNDPPLWGSQIVPQVLGLVGWGAETKCHRLSGLSNTHDLSHSSGSQEFEIRVSAGLAPSEDVGVRGLFHASLLASGGLLAIFGIP